MTEVRPIRADESSEFLKLLCDVFSLDFGRSSTVFYDEPMFDLRRKWALFEEGQMISILTTVPLEFGWGPAVGIAGVATRPDRQREGLAGRLLEHVVKASTECGESSAWLFARDPSLYLRCGFEPIDVVVRARFQHTSDEAAPTISCEEAQSIYDRWSVRQPTRLRRNDRRWSYWNWTLKTCTALGEGYVCHEGKQIRECVFESAKELVAPRDAEWFGLQTMASSMNLPVADAQFELHLMGYRAPGMPQMFMTDQF